MTTEYTVIIPTYRGFKRLPTVLDSLCRQSVPKEKLEVVVVDDGSPDISQNDIDSFLHTYAEINLRVLRMPENKGPAAARNFGIANSSGKIIFFTDDDTEAPALWMETHLNIYCNHPEVSAVGGWYVAPLNIQRKNIYTLFFELRYQAIHARSLFQASNSNLFMQRRSNGERGSFSAGNTANFSIKRMVTAKVQFDERFIAPGHEDIFYCHTIQRAGFIVYAIPYFIYHGKVLATRSFITMTLNRGLGLYVYSRLVGVDALQNEIKTRKQFIQYVRYLSEMSRLVKNKKKALIFIAYVYCFIVSRFDFWYRRTYQRKRRHLTLQKL